MLIAVPSSQSGTISKVYAVGGLGGGGRGPPVDGAGAIVEKFDVKSGVWERAGKVDEALEGKLLRSNHAAAVVASKLFVFGGESPDGTYLDDVLVMDLETEKWSVMEVAGKVPAPRSGHSATAIGDLIYIVGGRSAEKVFSGVHVLDTKAKSWIVPLVAGPLLPKSLYAHTAHALSPTRILILGGCLGHDAASSEIWFLEVDTPYVREKRDAAGEGITVIAWSRGSFLQSPRPVVICGPSGVGKGTLISRLMKDFPTKCGFSVSHTTRKPRVGEEDGVHYNFTTREAMEAEIREGRFLEKADVHGNLYGTSVAAVKKVTDSGKVCILDIDVQGAEQVRAHPDIDAVFVFIQPPSFEELEKRLRGRGTESEEQIQKRLKNARAELEKGKDSSLFPNSIVNDDLDAAYHKLKKFLDFGPKKEAAAGTENAKGTVPNRTTAESPREVESEEEEEDLGEDAAQSRWAHAAVRTMGSKIIFHGGCSKEHAFLDDLHVLETRNITGGAPGITRGLEWEECEEVPQSLWASFLSALRLSFSQRPVPRHSHQAVVLSEKRILYSGGTTHDESVEADSFLLTLQRI